jgi:hypothetical protein
MVYSDNLYPADFGKLHKDCTLGSGVQKMFDWRPNFNYYCFHLGRFRVYSTAYFEDLKTQNGRQCAA